jgi:hypothetical protein
MERSRELDAAGAAGKTVGSRGIIPYLNVKTCLPQALCFLLLCAWLPAQTDSRPPEPVTGGETTALDSAEQEYQSGLELARLGQLEDARAALVHGSRLAPEDKRFFIELAGVAYRQKKTE